MSFLLDTVFRKNESRLIFPISFEIIEHLKKKSFANFKSKEVTWYLLFFVLCDFEFSPHSL
jgi:hypothetical protein